MKHSARLKVSAATGVAGGLVFGFASGVIAAAQLGIQTQFETTTLGITFVTCALLVGALIGAILTNRLYEPIGPRASIILGGGVVLVGSIASGIVATDLLWLLILCRLVTGLGVGVLSVASPQYLSEMAPDHRRGALVSSYQVMISFGILLAYLVGLIFTGMPQGWRWMFAATIIPAFAVMALSLLGSDSPKFALSRGHEAAALTTLSAIKPDVDPDAALTELKRARDAPKSTLADLGSPAVRPALRVALVLAIAQVITGINAIMYYAPQIFKLTGFTSDSSAVLATVSVGVVSVLSTVLAIPLVDRFGRRPLLIGGMTAMAAFAIVLAVVLIAGSSGAATSIISLIAIFGFVVGFGMSLGPLAWLLISEVFPAKVRSRGVSVAMAANWATNIFVSLIFLVMLGAIGAGWSFAIFGGLTLLALVFVAKEVPETKGRTLKEISEAMSAHAYSRER